MNDIRRPKKRMEPVQLRTAGAAAVRPVVSRPMPKAQAPQPAPNLEKIPNLNLPEIEELPQLDESVVVTNPPKKRRIWLKLLLVIFLLAGVFGGGWLWYQSQLQPVSNDQNATRVRLEIASGTTPDRIADQLLEAKLIRNTLAFSIYTRMTNTQNKLQAGVYNLSPAESLPAIVGHLTSGKAEEFSLTFYPGATLLDPSDTPIEKKTDVTTVLLKAGYKEAEIKAALDKKYDHPLLADKPASASLEGYVYGETYRFATNASVEDILIRTFDELKAQIDEYDMVNKFKQQGLTLYQGITLASIIQREVSGEADEAQVAQVFLKRLRQGTVLGSDVTYKYAAKQMGLIDSPDQDSPYNTRRFGGLTPTPISAPGLGALMAVTKPAAGDYEFFLAGDDGKTYFAHTEAEHEANIRNHCQIGCAL